MNSLRPGAQASGSHGPSGTAQPASGTPMRYIVGIYHVYTMYIRRGFIYLVYTTYILWISIFHFRVVMCKSMLYTIAMDKDNVMLKPERFQNA